MPPCSWVPGVVGAEDVMALLRVGGGAQYQACALSARVFYPEGDQGGRGVGTVLLVYEFRGE